MKDYNDDKLLVKSDVDDKKYPFNIKKPEPNSKTLEDFEGNLETKEQIEELVNRMAFPEIYTSHGISLEKGILLEGEPGNGKTFSIKCIQGELYKSGRLFGVMEYSIGEYGSKYINENSVTLNDFFKTGLRYLKDYSKFSGIIYFFDEANSFMSDRSNQHQHKEDNKLLETLMMNMQNIHNRDTEEYMFFATNFKNALDKASIREGRIDRKIHFSNPDYDSRKSIFEKEIFRINKKSGYEILPSKISKNIIESSEGFSCIDCMQTIDKSVRSSIHKGFKRIKNEKSDELISAGQMFVVEEIKILETIENIRSEKGLNYKGIGFRQSESNHYDAKCNV